MPPPPPQKVHSSICAYSTKSSKASFLRPPSLFTLPSLVFFLRLPLFLLSLNLLPTAQPAKTWCPSTRHRQGQGCWSRRVLVQSSRLASILSASHSTQNNTNQKLKAQVLPQEQEPHKLGSRRPASQPRVLLRGPPDNAGACPQKQSAAQQLDWIRARCHVVAQHGIDFSWAVCKASSWTGDTPEACSWRSHGSVRAQFTAPNAVSYYELTFSLGSYQLTLLPMHEKLPPLTSCFHQLRAGRAGIPPGSRALMPPAQQPNPLSSSQPTAASGRMKRWASRVGSTYRSGRWTLCCDRARPVLLTAAPD